MSILMFTLLGLPLVIAFVVGIIAIASSKKLNTMMWAMLAIVGPILILVITNLIFYIVDIRMFEFRIVITLGLPIVYLIVLLAMVFSKPSQKDLNAYLKRCDNCQSMIKPEMVFCTNCGANVSHL